MCLHTVQKHVQQCTVKLAFSETDSILSNQNGRYALQVLIVFRGHHKLHSTLEIHMLA